jgi:hypothetical protein
LNNYKDKKNEQEKLDPKNQFAGEYTENLKIKDILIFIQSEIGF